MIVSGSVLDNEMGIIPFANVEVVGENRFTTTDASGRFSIVANSASSLLKFSHAAFDFDTISVAEFQNDGYIQLWPSSLDEAVVINPNTPKPKEKDNSLLWFLGIGSLIAIAIGVSSSQSKKNQSVKVTA